MCKACERTSATLSHNVFTRPVVDVNTIQFNRGGHLPVTRIFYSTVTSNSNDNDQRMQSVQPTLPTNAIERGNNRRRKAPRKSLKDLKNRKFCLSCLTDFKTRPYNLRDACLNPLTNLTEAELRFLNMCPETSQFCQTEVFTVNGVFSALERRCSTICTPVCFQRYAFYTFADCLLIIFVFSNSFFSFYYFKILWNGN